MIEDLWYKHAVVYCLSVETFLDANGDEIGMGDDLSLEERDAVRTPMQWSDEAHGGFTKAEKPVLPVISGGPCGYEHLNVARQLHDPGSLLNWTERIIRARKEIPEIGWADFAVLRTGDTGVLALRYDWRGNSVLFLHNFHAEPREVAIDPGVEGVEPRLMCLLSEDHSMADEGGRHRIVLEGYGYRWFRVGGLDWLLRRSRI